MKQLSEKMGYKLRDFLFPLFIAVAGTNQTVSVMDSMSILGPDMVRARLRHAVNTVGGPSKKKQNAGKKEFALLQTKSHKRLRNHQARLCGLFYACAAIKSIKVIDMAVKSIDYKRRFQGTHQHPSC